MVIRCQIMFWVAIRRIEEKEMMMNLNFLKALLVSRKFWLAFIGVIAAVYMFATGQISADVLVDAIVVLVGLVIGGIAAEDVAKHLKSG